MSEDRYLNYGKLITDSHTGEILITCKSNKNAEQITSLLNTQQAMIDQLEKENTALLDLAEALGVKIVEADDE